MLRGRQVLGFKFRRRSLVYGYIPDFWCPEAKVAIEIDGREYPAKQERDAVRDTRLFSHGIHTVHIASDLVWRDSATALEVIQAAIEMQMGRPDL
jgi:very-short-patch-repair endonuclease